MSYCPKCGNKVDETMAFCPRCGAPLKAAPQGQQAPVPAQPYYRRNEKSEKNEKQEKQEKNQRPERGEKQEKGEAGFIGYLIGGLILITLGLFSVLQISGYFTVDSGQSWAIMLLIIGIIIIVGAIYIAMVARKRSPQPS
jgi:predicted lipid-binding transport protein (Tim44 family)